MQIRESLASIFCEDAEVAWQWYTRLLGRSWDAVPDTGCRAWELVPGAWLQVMPPNGDQPSTSLALTVDSVDKARAELHSRGVETAEPVVIPDFVVFCEVTDPEGHVITLVEHLVADSTRGLSAPGKESEQ